MRRLLIVGLMAGVLLVGQIRGVAETKPTDPVRFAVEFRADVTDNRDSVSINKESNVDLYLVPRVDFWLDRERLTLDLLLAPSLRWRSDPSSIQNDFELLTQAKGDLRYHLSELVSLRLLDSFSRTEDPRIEEGAVVRENQTYHVNLVEGGVNVKPNPRSLVDAYGRFYVKRYVEEVVADTSNEDRLDLGGLLRWYLQPTIGCDAIVTFSDYGFDSPGRVERDFSTLFGGVGIEKIFNPNLRGGIKAGVQVVDYKDNTLDNGTAPAGQIYVGGSTVPSMRVNGAVTFGVRNADVYPYASQEYWDVRGGVECDVAAQVMVFASGTYRRSDYDTEVPAAAVQVFRRLGINPGGEETTVVGQIGVGYKLTHESSVRLAYTYEDVDSEVGQNFTKNTGTLALFYQF